MQGHTMVLQMVPALITLTKACFPRFLALAAEVLATAILRRR